MHGGGTAADTSQWLLGAVARAVHEVGASVRENGHTLDSCALYVLDLAEPWASAIVPVAGEFTVAVVVPSGRTVRVRVGLLHTEQLDDVLAIRGHSRLCAELMTPGRDAMRVHESGAVAWCVVFTRGKVQAFQFDLRVPRELHAGWGVRAACGAGVRWCELQDGGEDVGPGASG